MKILHLCNTLFEQELAQNTLIPIEKILTKKPADFLQFLPLFYAGAQDGIVVSNLTPPSFFQFLPSLNLLHFHTQDFSSYSHLESWGYSPSIAKWAALKKISYPHPPFSVVNEVNSKTFSFVNSPILPGAELLTCYSEAQKWISSQKEAIVFKSALGFSGLGHLIQTDPDLASALPFLQREWEQNRAVIAEPWVERIFDFSTQWIITPTQECRYLGATVLNNDLKGKYRSTVIGMPVNPVFLEKHREIALDVLKKIATCGYFGNIGVDAMVYRLNGEILLHPIVEINARKTMGYAALTLQQQHFPEKILTLSFSPKSGFTVNSIKA